jgi:hypothetical protein
MVGGNLREKSKRKAEREGSEEMMDAKRIGKKRTDRVTGRVPHFKSEGLWISAALCMTFLLIQAFLFQAAE